MYLRAFGMGTFVVLTTITIFQKHYHYQNFRYSVCLKLDPRGVPWISSDGEMRRIFLSVKFTISGFFG